MKQYLDKSRLLINTSSAEGFPNTFVHAFAHGVPVVSLDVDPDNIIKRYNLGFHVNGDVRVAVNKIKELIEDNSKWKSMSESCYSFALEHLNIHKNVNQLKSLFQV